MSTQDIVAKLWNLCDVLRDDGITYHQYVTELTYLLFLKMAKETDRDGPQLPKGYRWDDLEAKDGVEQLDFYRELLLTWGTKARRWCRRSTPTRRPRCASPKNLEKLVDAIDELDWYSAKTEGFGDLYEGLLEKNASEKKSGAGQYFTPRPLIDSMVRLVKPQPGELVQDPAAGTCGFLIAADRYIKDATNRLDKLPVRQQDFQKYKAFYGVELVHDTHRLALMNLMLHDIEGDLAPRRLDVPGWGPGCRSADVILTNPPFGTKKGGGGGTRDDLTFPTSNKQLAFLQHIYRGLKPGGRAAVVLPDNVLFEDNVGAQIRADLMDKCDLHTILRLPTGIFYAQGVKTNVLFFSRGAEGHRQHEGRLDLRHAHQRARVRQAHAVHRASTSPSSRRRSATTRWARASARTKARRAAGAQVHPRGDRQARRQPRHQLAEGRRPHQRRGLAGTGGDRRGDHRRPGGRAGGDGGAGGVAGTRAPRRTSSYDHRRTAGLVPLLTRRGRRDQERSHAWQEAIRDGFVAPRTVPARGQRSAWALGLVRDQAGARYDTRDR